MTCTAIAECLRAAESVVIVAHINPDGDALGAASALRLGLLALGKTVRYVLPSAPVEMYHFLPAVTEAEVITTEDQARAEPEAEVLMAVDCGDNGRLGAIDEMPRKVLVNLDHHGSNDHFGDINWVKPESACTCQMIETLLSELGVEISTEIAECLYTGLVFDTGRFMHSNSGPEEFRCAARLVEAGIDAAALNRRLTYTKTPDDLAAQGIALQNLFIADDPRIAGVTLTAEQMASLPKVQDWGELVEHPRSLQGVEIAFIMRQQTDRTIRCSLRSNPPFEVAPVAVALGGGGHAQAAGCTLEAQSLATALPDLVQRLTAQLAIQ